MCFVLKFKMDVLRTSRERYSLDVILEPLEDIFGMFLQKSETIKTANS